MRVSGGLGGPLLACHVRGFALPACESMETKPERGGSGPLSYFSDETGEDLIPSFIGGEGFHRADSPVGGSVLGVTYGKPSGDLNTGVSSGLLVERDGARTASSLVVSAGADPKQRLSSEVGEAMPDPRVATRSSARLTLARQVTALARAKIRKSALLEGEISGSSLVRCQRSAKTVLKKSALCGVKLTGLEAEELHKFLQRG